MPAQPRLAVCVTGKDHVAEGVVLLTLRRPDGLALPAWEPGAHVDLLLAEDLVRQYSLCGTPGDTSSYRVAVLREDLGRGGSRYIHDELEVGSLLSIGGLRNHFPLVEADRYVFVAGGIGITPILPMIAAVHAQGASWRLAYGGRTRKSMAFGEDLVAAHPDETHIQPQDELGMLDLDALLRGTHSATTVYCCGPEPLLRAIEAVCADETNVDLHLELFASKKVESTIPIRTFEVELERSGKVLTVGPDETIIDVLENAGIFVGASCLEGICGSCETVVLAGEPDHRDSVLTADERAAGETMMVCVSRSCGPRMTLDL